MSSTLSEALRFTKEEVITHEERLFIEGFKDFGEIGPPLISRLPKWLWGGGGIPLKKHPNLKIKFVYPLPDQLKNALTSGASSGVSTSTSSSSPSTNASVSAGSALIGAHNPLGIDTYTPTTNPATVQSPLLQSTLPPHFPDSLPQLHQQPRTSVSRGTLVHTHSSHSFSTRVSVTDHQTTGSVSVTGGNNSSTARQQSMLSSQIIPTSDLLIGALDEMNRASNSIGSRGGGGSNAAEGGGTGTAGRNEEEDDDDDGNGAVVEELVPIRVSRTIMALDLEMGNQQK